MGEVIRGPLSELITFQAANILVQAFSQPKALYWLNIYLYIFRLNKIMNCYH